MTSKTTGEARSQTLVVTLDFSDLVVEFGYGIIPKDLA
jgi:hypothetical protein